MNQPFFSAKYCVFLAHIILLLYLCGQIATEMTATIKRANFGKELRDYIIITIAMMSYAIGWGVFLLPNNITTGGVAGVSSILYWATGIPVQLSYFVINGVLLAVGMALLLVKVLGRKDGTFSSQHIHDSQAMRDRGIHCVMDQDREMRSQKKLKINH